MDDGIEHKGKAKGGAARMALLTTEQRKAQAKKGAAARWSGEVKQATHGSEDHPLRIGNIDIACYVLDDGRRVLQQSGLIGALNMSHGGSYSKGGDRLAKFTAQGRLKPFVSSELIDRTAEPIRFRTTSGSLAYGYEATVLADICEAVLAARSAGVLQKQQEHIARQAEILVRGFARIGIIALVDEATGYQRDRAKDALARLLEAWVAKELQTWVQTFPPEFYEHMFRLRGLDFSPESVRRPQYFGHLTNDIVYKRLEAGVLKELKRVTPRNSLGRPTARYTQSLTKNIGYPKLKEHLGAVVAFMRISKSWGEFMNLLDEHYPRKGETPMLPMDYDQEKDDGKGL
ncbi:P63C domain-containing protein [Hyphomonas sp.]|uniref:P63C domain-containing protein n=1 Tax=Hyphomonas sp. TaxID=87 RepID=UPI0025C5D682|nr:P63C domain-containing protein [Hyphomonas sp.]